MKNEFVMVPRAELVRLQESMDPHRGAVAWGIVCDLLAKPAESQGEPVAWVRDDGDGCFELTTAGDGIAFPVYTHADPGEVERLRNELGEARGEYDRAVNKVEELRGIIRGLEQNVLTHSQLSASMRTQLAEAYALMCDIDDWMDREDRTPGFEIEKRMADVFRSASAEPSAPVEPLYPKCTVLKDANVRYSNSKAPVEIDERAEFEAAWSARIERLRIRERGNEFYRVQPNDLYRWSNVQDAWELWQARAALERKP